MILRDSQGEVDVPFFQDFLYKTAKLTVICPDSRLSTPDKQIICVRMVSGFLDVGGQRFEIGADGYRPLLSFAADLVATMVRAYRLTDGRPVDEALGLQPERNVSKAHRASKKKANAEQNQPTNQTGLFD